MLLTYEDQSVDFDLDLIDSYDKVAISISGGTDSALILFLIAKYLPHKEIYPCTFIEMHAPTSVWYVREIIQTIHNLLPNNNIQPLHEVKLASRSDPEIVEAAKKDLLQLIEEGKEPRMWLDNSFDGGWVKKWQIRREWKTILKDFNIRLTISGLTSNPPIEVAKTNGFYELCEPRRFRENITEDQLIGNIIKSYRPWLKVDKKFIAGMYKQYNLMDTIFPFTQSCVGNADNTNYFTEPCKKCYWCHEKLWSFGTYDICANK